MLLTFPAQTTAPVDGATMIIAPLPDAEATALSYDGRTLVGSSEKRAFAWRLTDGEEGTVEILSDPGAALAVSDDGSVIVGNGLEPGQAQIKGGHWIGTIPSAEPPWGPRIGGIAAGVSGDGKIVVGSAILNYDLSTTPSSRKAKGIGEAAILRFVPTGVNLSAASASADEEGQAPDASASANDSGVEGFELGWGSEATAISRDGDTIVGVLPRTGPAFRWTQKTGTVPIGDLPGGAIGTIPRAVNEDGSVIVGSARSANGQEAFRWTETEGLIPLGDLPGIAFRSTARAVSADGRIIVGTGAGERIGDSGGGDRAFIWDAKNGIRDLWKVLAQQGVAGRGLPANFSRWRLRDAVSVRITSDGHPQIAGTAVDHVGRRLAFVATLGETVAP